MELKDKKYLLFLTANTHDGVLRTHYPEIQQKLESHSKLLLPSSFSKTVHKTLLCEVPWAESNILISEDKGTPRRVPTGLAKCLPIYNNYLKRLDL